MAHQLPPFHLLKSNYPDEDPITVKRNIGGHVNADWVNNTCAIRLSRALNYSGVPLPRNFAGLKVISGADKKWYAYHMQELKKWVEYMFGPPSLVKSKPAGGTIQRSEFAGHQGIMAFDIHFSDAQGHIDLWDGQDFEESIYATSDYFVRATQIVLWEAPN